MAEINDVRESLEMAHQGINRLKEQPDHCLGQNSNFERRLSDLEKENSELKSYSEELEDYILTLDSTTRKRNLIISGLGEGNDENAETLPLLIYNFFQPYIDTLETADIDCAYRLGQPGTRARPILCKFAKESIQNETASARNILKDEDSNTKVYLNDDLPQLLNERKAIFRSLVKLAKSQKITASTKGDKITINNITYTHRNLDCLPAGVTVEDAKLLRLKGVTPFNPSTPGRAIFILALSAFKEPPLSQPNRHINTPGQ